MGKIQGAYKGRLRAVKVAIGMVSFQVDPGSVWQEQVCLGTPISPPSAPHHASPVRHMGYRVTGLGSPALVLHLTTGRLKPIADCD